MKWLRLKYFKANSGNQWWSVPVSYPACRSRCLLQREERGEGAGRCSRELWHGHETYGQQRSDNTADFQSVSSLYCGWHAVVDGWRYWHRIMIIFSVTLCVFSAKIRIFFAPPSFVSDWSQNGLVWMWEDRKVKKSADMSWYKPLWPSNWVFVAFKQF